MKRSTSTCQSCHAAIIWARTAAGKPIPLDVEPVPHGNIVLSRASGLISIVKPDGVTKRHVSHFSTCPNAAAHRKPKEQLGLPGVRS